VLCGQAQAWDTRWPMAEINGSRRTNTAKQEPRIRFPAGPHRQAGPARTADLGGMRCVLDWIGKPDRLNLQTFRRQLRLCDPSFRRRLVFSSTRHNGGHELKRGPWTNSVRICRVRRSTCPRCVMQDDVIGRQDGPGRTWNLRRKRHFPGERASYRTVNKKLRIGYLKDVSRNVRIRPRSAGPAMHDEEKKATSGRVASSKTGEGMQPRIRPPSIDLAAVDVLPATRWVSS